jgi:hypothetical protein
VTPLLLVKAQIRFQSFFMLITLQPSALARENGVSIVVHDHAVADLLVTLGFQAIADRTEALSRVNGGRTHMGWIEGVLAYGCLFRSQCTLSSTIKARRVALEFVDTQYNVSRPRFLTS